VLFTFPQVFSPTIKKLGIFIPAFYGILVSAQFIACVGMWYMKQWGVNLYLLSFFAKTLFFITTGQTGPVFYFSAFLNALFICLMLRYYPRMDPNL
jgi:hypothetical protein